MFTIIFVPCNIRQQSIQTQCHYFLIYLQIIIDFATSNFCVLSFSFSFCNLHIIKKDESNPGIIQLYIYCFVYQIIICDQGSPLVDTPAPVQPTLGPLDV